MNDELNQLLAFIPAKYRALLMLIIAASPYATRTIYALMSGRGLRGVFAAIWLGTNVPKGNATQAGPTDRTGSGVAAVSILLLMLGLAFLLPGCATKLDAGADPIEVRAEQTIGTAADLVDLFVHVEFDNEVLIKAKAPKVHAYAEWLRSFEPSGEQRGLALIGSANKARLAYKQNRSPENKASLEAIMAALETIATEVQTQLAAVQGAGVAVSVPQVKPAH